MVQTGFPVVPIDVGGPLSTKEGTRGHTEHGRGRAGGRGQHGRGRAGAGTGRAATATGRGGAGRG